MKRSGIIYFTLISIVFFTSCFKDIDTVPIPRTVDNTFVVEYSIKNIQSFYRFFENTVVLVDSSLPRNWDLAFESAGPGNKVLLGWASASTAVKTGKYNMSEITQDFILDLIANSPDWDFDDPAYSNIPDSLSLKDWENGEVYLQSRGLEKDNYYVLQFISRDENYYTFRYASAQSLENVKEYTIVRGTGFNYMYFSYQTDGIIYIEPNSQEWDIVFTPYLGWWETTTPGEYSPYTQSGILINNEFGVRVAHVFDTIAFSNIDSTYIDNPKYEFIDMKGAIGSNWKVLGAVGSDNLYNMDPDKKYLLKKFDYESNRILYFKFQIVDYKLDGEDHHPTVEFKYLGSD